MRARRDLRPGYKLVRDARAAGHAVVTIPALRGGGGPDARRPADRPLPVLGFLPPKEKARADAIAEVAAVRATLVLYESGPRLGACLATLAAVLGDREAAVTREISKRFEEAVTGTLTTLADRYADAPPRGEIVIVVAPPGEAPPASAEEGDTALAEALTRLPPPRPPAKVAKRLGLDRKALYARALAMKAEG